MATYMVYIAQFTSMPIFHDALYVEIEPGSGRLYQVMGGHGPGWQYETKSCDNIEESQQFYRKHFKGTLAAADLRKVDQICRTIPMPRNQVVAGITLPRDCRHWVVASLKELEQQGIFEPSK